MQSFESLVQKYDIAQLSNYDAKTVEEIFFAISANYISGNISKSQEVIDKNKKLLQEEKAYPFLAHTILFAQGKDDAALLVQAINNESYYKKNLKIYGLFSFYIGYYFLRRKIMNLAYEYYKKSQKAYRKADLTGWEWKTNFNIFLCKSYMNNFVHFDEDFEELMTDFSKLPYYAQQSFSKFLIWLLLFRGKRSEAYDMCCKHQLDTVSKDYLMYLDFTLDKKATFKNQKATSVFQETIIEIAESLPNFNVIGTKIETFESRYRFMTYHAYLHKLFQLKEFQKVISLHQKYRHSFQDDKTLVIQPFSILEIVLMSAIKLRKFNLEREILAQIKIDEPWWIYTSCVQKAKHLNKKMSINSIVFNPEKHSLSFKGKTISIAKMKKIRLLLNLLTSDENRIDLKYLTKSIYGDKTQDSQLEKTKALLQRIKTMLNVDFYQITGDTIEFISNHPIIRINKKGAKTLVDLKMITKKLKSAPNKSLTASELADSLNVNKRTINMKLRDLVNQNLVKKLGHGPLVRYQLQEY